MENEVGSKKKYSNGEAVFDADVRMDRCAGNDAWMGMGAVGKYVGCRTAGNVDG